MDNLILTAVSCFCTFLTGFAAGMMWRPKPKNKPEPVKDTGLGELMQRQMLEYKNFLSYDGSEQAPIN